MDDLKNLKYRLTDSNNLSPENIGQNDGSEIFDNVSRVEAHFRNIEEKIISKIKKADAVVGCVAWLTSFRILNALAQRRYGTSIVVQKEDFLRPDINDTDSTKFLLREKYEKLNPIPEYSYGYHQRKSNWLENPDDERIDISVRCVGYGRSEKRSIPRMHHKFLVFIESGEDYFSPKPYAVWTGSYNMSNNAKLSMENGVYIESEDVARVFFNEWHNALMISEALDWSSSDPEPTIQFNYLDAREIP